MIPGEKLLPSPVILQKLAAVDTNAPKQIIGMLAVIAQKRYVEEKNTLKITLKEKSRKAFWGGFWEGFGALAFFAVPTRTIPLPTYTDPLSSAESINIAWAQTGNYMRQAIKEYCALNPEIAFLANLSEKDFRDLEMLDIARPKKIDTAAHVGYVAPSYTQ